MISIFSLVKNIKSTTRFDDLRLWHLAAVFPEEGRGFASVSARRVVMATGAASRSPERPGGSSGEVLRMQFRI